MKTEAERTAGKRSEKAVRRKLHGAAARATRCQICRSGDAVFIAASCEKGFRRSKVPAAEIGLSGTNKCREPKLQQFKILRKEFQHSAMGRSRARASRRPSSIAAIAPPVPAWLLRERSAVYSSARIPCRSRERLAYKE